MYMAWFRDWTGDEVLDRYIRKHEYVLDIGCGEGHLAEPVLARGAKWTGLEINPRCCQVMKERGLDCICGTLETVELPGDSYDTVIASQVIEHTSDPKSFLMNCVRLLRPGGRVLISTPNVTSRYRSRYDREWIHWFVPYHQVLFSPKGLARLGEQCGLELRNYWTKTPSSWALSQLNYRRPPRGQIGDWRNTGTLHRLQPDLLSLRLRLEDKFLGNGDGLLAELIKPT
jgi:SAM-dependent methyltransferase